MSVHSGIDYSPVGVFTNGPMAVAESLVQIRL